ncbi:response regulator [bacterium (Candidatus Torokbacteria) CG_4_10_14_0_2_um_filter_35_8]|nr:MAG: response regulator [bacterium (Candidatus Torokbacteria) CG_4_10_14_0_2_um_filter_35_8]
MNPSEKTILIIEDEQTLLKSLQLHLESEGFKVILASNGQKGIEQAKQKKPDLIILDLILPLKNGVEVLEELEKDSSVCNIPVLVISNIEDPEQMKKIKAMKIEDYLVKAQYKLKDIGEKAKEILEA